MIQARLSGDIPAFEWTDSHSWYLLMGGFYFDTSTVEPYIPDSPPLILTAEAIDLLVSTCPPLLPEIAEDAIQDRSKADTITKCLAALQAIYQLAQCATRWRAKLAVSQLELTTCGHILCALAIYFCWFRKPKDVEIRTKVDATWSDPVCAWLSICMSSRFWRTRCPPHITHLFPVTEINQKFNDISAEDNTNDSILEDEKTLADPDGNDLAGKQALTLATTSDALRPGRAHLEHQGPPLKTANAVTIPDQTLNIAARFSKRRDFSCPLSERDRLNPMVEPTRFKELVIPILGEGFRPAKMKFQDQESLACVSLALQYFSFWGENVVTSTASTSSGTVKIEKGAKTTWTRPPYEEGGLYRASVHIWPHVLESLTWHLGLVFPATMIAFLTACYGGIHASAWSYHFPTPIEASLWRVSSLVITSSGIFMMLDRIAVVMSRYFINHIVCRDCHAGQPCVKYQSHEAKWLHRWLQTFVRPFTSLRRWILVYRNAVAFHERHPPVKTMVKVLLCIWFLLFVAARMFVVIEAFISLKSLPIGAYNTPNWSQWFIHL